MPPSLHRREDSTALKIGLISVVIIAILSLMALVIYLTLGRLRNQQYLEACKRDPYLTRREFSRRRKLSAAQRIEEEEDQRMFILRKTQSYSRMSNREECDAVDNHSSRNGGRETPRKSEESQVNDADPEREMKAWEAGLGQEQEQVLGQNMPFLGPHPAMVEISRSRPRLETATHTRRSNSLTRTPLLAVPDSEDESDQPPKTRQGTAPRDENSMTCEPLWERRRSARRYASYQNLVSREASPTPPPSSSSKRDVGVAAAAALSPTGQILHVASREVKALEIKHIMVAPSMRVRAASMEPLGPRRPSPRPSPRPTPSTSSSINSMMLSSPPPSGPLPALPVSGTRTRSYSATPSPFPNLVSPPPPTARLPFTSPRTDGFLSPEPELHANSVPRQRERAPSWDRPQRPRQRSPANDTPFTVASSQRIRSLSPSVVPRRKPVPSRTPTPKSSSASLASAAGPPVNLSVGRRLSVSSSIMATPIELIARVPLPTPRAPLPPPQKRKPSAGFEDEATIVAENTLVFPEKAYMVSPSPVPQNPPTKPEEPRRAPSEVQAMSAARRSPPPRATEARTWLATPERLEKELERPREADKSTQQRHSTQREEPHEARFSEESEESEEEELVQFRGPNLLVAPSPEPTRPQGLRQTQSHQYLPVPATRNRSNSNEDGNRPGQHVHGSGMQQDAASRRLRARSFDNRATMAQGKWELQVSILDQTGAGFRRSSRSPSPSPAEASGENERERLPVETREPSQTRSRSAASSREVPPLRTTPFTTTPPTASHSPDPQTAYSSSSSTSIASPPQPPTPRTPQIGGAAALCHANFASPAKVKLLAEAPRSVPYKPSPAPLFYTSAPPVPASNASPPLFSSPDYAAAHRLAHNPSMQYTGPARRSYIELNYGRDTMKESFGSTAKPVRNIQEAELSSRLSGPPDMPAFF